MSSSCFYTVQIITTKSTVYPPTTIGSPGPEGPLPYTRLRPTSGTTRPLPSWGRLLVLVLTRTGQIPCRPSGVLPFPDSRRLQSHGTTGAFIPTTNSGATRDARGHGWTYRPDLQSSFRDFCLSSPSTTTDWASPDSSSLATSPVLPLRLSTVVRPLVALPPSGDLPRLREVPPCRCGVGRQESFVTVLPPFLRQRYPILPFLLIRSVWSI